MMASGYNSKDEGEGRRMIWGQRYGGRGEAPLGRPLVVIGSSPNVGEPATEGEVREAPEQHQHDEQLDDFEVRVLAVQVQVVDDDVGVFEVTVTGVTAQRLSVQPEHRDHQPDDAAPQEAGLHHNLHDPRDLVREVEPVDSQAQERRYHHRTHRTAVLKPTGAVHG